MFLFLKKWPIAYYTTNGTMAHVAYESRLRSAVRSSMHLCTGNWMAIRCVVVYCARAVHAIRARIKCWHCTNMLSSYGPDVNQMLSREIVCGLTHYNMQYVISRLKSLTKY